MDKLVSLRKNKGLTQEELAVLIGKKANAISQYELGKRTPNVKVLRQLAQVFDCSIDELVD